MAVLLKRLRLTLPAPATPSDVISVRPDPLDFGRSPSSPIAPATETVTMEPSCTASRFRSRSSSGLYASMGDNIRFLVLRSKSLMTRAKPMPIVLVY